MHRLLFGLFVLLACGNDAFAFATCTWTGAGANANWSNPDNWDTCGGIRSVPLDTDTLIFPDGVPGKTNSNDLVNLKPATITLKAQDYNISGNAITLSTALNTDTGPGISGPKFGPAITLGAGATFNCIGGYFAFISGALNLNGFGAVVDGVCNTSLKGPVSGGGGLYKYGTGTLYMQTGANNYTGVTTINNGTVYVGTDTALGATGPGNGTTVKATATLTLYLGVNLYETIDLDGGTLDNYLLDNRVSGPINLINSSNVSAASNTTLRLSGPLTGDAMEIFKLGAGTVVIENASNVGYVTVGNGTLEFYGDVDGGAITGGTLAGAGPMTNTLVLNTGGRLSPGSGAGRNPGVFSGPRLSWQNGGICELQLGDRADMIDLSIGLSKVGSGTYLFEFHDGSTPPKVGVAYPLITFDLPPNFIASDFSFSYVGTGAGAGMSGTFALTSNALTFTPSSVNSDLIFRDGVER